MTTVVKSEESKLKVSIQHFYVGQSVLITGGTGFMGKILIEKLLRSCPKLSAIYLIIRPKKGQDVHKRVEEILLEPMFDRLKNEYPEFRKKIIVVEGDCKLPGLGISTKDKDVLLKEVSIVFHAAATVRFNEKLKHAIDINVAGTKCIIDLCKSMRKLKAFIHVSTLYIKYNAEDMLEKFYELPITGDKILALTQVLDEEELNDLETILRKDFPNTYCYTKAIAEQVVKQNARGLSIGVFRPGIVVSAYKEPVPGWNDNLFGPTGTLVAGSIGLLRVVNCNESVVAEIVPVDLTINALIASAWDVALNKNQDDDPFIYNFSSSWANPLTWKEYLNLACKHEIPPITCYGCIWVILIKNYYLYYITSLFLQTLPAVLIDAGLIIIGKKPFVVKTYKKIDKYLALIAYYAVLGQGEFNNDRIKSLWKTLSLDDQKIFPFSMENFDWDNFMKNCMLGVRIYLLKDSLDTVPAAKKHRTRLFIIYTILKYTIIVLGILIFYNLAKFFFQL